MDDIDAPASVEDIDEARDWFGRDPDVRERAEERGITSATLIVGALIAWVLRHAEANAGEPYDKFAESIRKRIEAAWMSPNAVAAQTATHEALQRSYINERVQGLRDGSNGRPQMWRFIAVLDRRTTSVCLGYHGTERYSNDPWWAGKIPPLHPWCRSTVVVAHPAASPAEGGVFAVSDSEFDAGLNGPDFGADHVTRWRKERSIVVVTVDHPRKINGALAAYDHERKQILIARYRGVLAGKFAAGDYAVQDGAQSAAGAIERILMHELGHAVHFHLMDRSANEAIEQARKAIRAEIVELFGIAKKKKGGAISMYARKDFAEYFAESFAAYHFEPGELARSDGKMYDLIRQIYAEAFFHVYH